MTMKKIFILLLLCIFLTGCAAAPSYSEYEGRLITVHTDASYRIIVDTQTRVCYYVYYRDGLAPMLNTDGSPVLYEGVLPR